MNHTRDTKGGSQSCSIQGCPSSPARHHPLPLVSHQPSHHQESESSQPVHNVQFCRDDQLVQVAHHGNSHALRVIASKYIAKVSRRSYKLDLGVFGMRDLLVDLEVGEEVVDGLGGNTCPVDRVACAEMVFRLKGRSANSAFTMPYRETRR
jgi:hypothetical protein